MEQQRLHISSDNFEYANIEKDFPTGNSYRVSFFHETLSLR